METTLHSETVFVGRAIRLDVLDIELDDGTRSRREIIRHPGAVVVLAELDDGRFALVRQYRKAIECELLEAVAGTLEPGEDPAACAARELEEEAGCRATELTPLGSIVAAPGYSSERLHIFHAHAEPASDTAAPDVDERITVVLLSAAEIETQIREGRIEDAKTLAAWQLYRSRYTTARKDRERRSGKTISKTIP